MFPRHWHLPDSTLPYSSRWTARGTCTSPTAATTESSSSSSPDVPGSGSAPADCDYAVGRGGHQVNHRYHDDQCQCSAPNPQEASVFGIVEFGVDQQR